jgi:FixJ family two-component response regulator
MQKEPTSIVHIIDDDAGMRKSLVMLAGSAVLHARGYESAEAFLRESVVHQPGCVVLDLRMSGMSGLDLLQRLRADKNDIPVILISGHADVPAAIRGMKLGAVDLLEKPFEPAVLLEAIQRCVAISQKLHQQRREAALVRRRFEDLTARELELLGFIVDGRSNKQIAGDMGISVKTVANHRANLMAKSGASNAADLARLFTLHKSLSPPVQVSPDGGKSV